METVNNKSRTVEFSANSDKVPKVVNGVSERTKAPLPWVEKCSDTHDSVDYVEVGQMIMIQEGRNYVVLDGWSRKHGDYSVSPGTCDVQIKDVSPNGTFQMDGKMSIGLDGSGVMADADNCRWEFPTDITFTDGQVLVHAKQGAIVELNRHQVVTTGVTFSETEMTH